MMTKGESSGWRRFLTLWAVQTGSMTGEGLTAFALGIWIFQKTGSATAYTFMSAVTVLPTVLFLPLAGALADRWGHKRTLIVSDIGGLLMACTLAALFATGATSTCLVYAVTATSALVTSLQWPAYTAATTALVDEKRLPRASAMMQFGYVGKQVLAPVAAAAILVSIGVAGALAIDVATFAVAVVVVLLLRFPEPARAPERTSIRRELAVAFIDARARGLVELAVYVGATYFLGGFVVSLSMPLVLTIASPMTVGIVVSVMGAGMVVGSVLSAMVLRPRGGFRRLLAFDVVMSFSMLLAGFAASPALIAAAGFVFLFGLAGHMSEEQGLWQLRIPLEYQGRAMAIRRMLNLGSVPVSYALAGPLADRVFEPLMVSGGPLASSFGTVIGTGRGRGIALLLMCAGVAKLALVLVTGQRRSLRRLDAPSSASSP